MINKKLGVRIIEFLLGIHVWIDIAEVIAAVSLDKRSIGDGKPGPVTEKFISSFRNLVGKDGAII